MRLLENLGKHQKTPSTGETLVGALVAATTFRPFRLTVFGHAPTMKKLNGMFRGKQHSAFEQIVCGSLNPSRKVC